MCACVGLCAPLACRSWWRSAGVRPLRLELQEVVRHLMWVGTGPRSSARALSPLNRRTISPAPVTSL